jgi:hypothetical protein
MSSEQHTKAENNSMTPKASSRKRSEQRNLWLSRGSFVLSGLALVSVGYQSVARHWADADATQAVAEVTSAAPPREAITPPRALVEAPVVVEATERPSVTARVTASLSKGLAALKIKRLVVTQAVEDREPVAVTDVVDSETPVIAFVEVASGSTEEQQVVVTFEHEAGDQVSPVNLSVPGNKPRWRTWGRTYNVNRDGRWIAVVRDSRGEELGRTEFTVRRAS